jgi:hypothetical protein
VTKLLSVPNPVPLIYMTDFKTGDHDRGVMENIFKLTVEDI